MDIMCSKHNNGTILQNIFRVDIVTSAFGVCSWCILQSSVQLAVLVTCTEQLI